jgi:hypothetical protein
MMLEIIEVFAVQDNTDHSEGRGRSFVKAYTTSETCAKRIARRGYVQGSDNPIYMTSVYKVEGKYFPHNSEIRLVEPTKEDIDKDNFLTSYDGIVEKALDLGLTEEEIEILHKAKNLIET